LSIDAEFLSGQYGGKLFMICVYDTEQQQLPLIFTMTACEESAAAWEAQCLVFSQKVTKLIKHRGDKGITYDVISLEYVINNNDVYNKNGLY
jgi:hypothetical protein